MVKSVVVKIGVTSRGRSTIAAQFFPTFFNQFSAHTEFSTILKIASSHGELGGIGAPIVVKSRKYDFAFGNPAGIVRMAFLGKGFYKSKIPLRAIGVFPSWDHLIFAVRDKTGINSLEEIRDNKIPLLVSTRFGGKTHGTLFAIDQVLKGYGFSLKHIERWGGKILRVPNPGSRERMEHLKGGRVDAVFDEGIKNWGNEALSRGMKFLAIKDQILMQLVRLGFHAGMIGPKHFADLSQTIATVDFSGWVLFCHRNLPSLIAYKMAKAIDLCHKNITVDHFDKRTMTMREFIKGGEGGPMTIPLHPGAVKYYREKGHLKIL